jgi:hypothetical protein
VTKEQGQKLQKVYGFGLKIAIFYFKALSPTALKNYFETEQKPLLNRVKIKYPNNLPKPIEVNMYRSN